MLTTGQKRALHLAARAAGVDEPARRLIQRNIGGFHSAADRTATRAGFIAVMSFYEKRCGGHLAGFSKGYWAGEDERANPADALVHRIRKEARALGMAEARLEQFLAGPHMSAGACRELATAPAYWLGKLLEGLKAIRRRTAAGRQAS